jgi:hypothetical protein
MTKYVIIISVIVTCYWDDWACFWHSGTSIRGRIFVSARIRAGSRFKRFLCFDLMFSDTPLRCFRVPQVVIVPKRQGGRKWGRNNPYTERKIMCTLPENVAVPREKTSIAFIPVTFYSILKVQRGCKAVTVQSGRVLQIRSILNLSLTTKQWRLHKVVYYLKWF